MVVIRFRITAGLALVLLVAGAGWADDVPATRPRPAGVDVQGRRWELPVSGRATAVVFLQPGQKHSEVEVAQVRETLRQAKEVAIIGVVSGPEAAKRARAMGQWEWPLLVDEAFAISGQFEVYAWPTTIVFDAQGKQVGRVAGNPASLKSSLAAYVAYVTGAMSREQLEDELTRLRIVEDSGEQKAMRHLLLVEEFAASGRWDDAAAQLKEARALSPTSEPVRLLMARGMLLLGEGGEAEGELAGVPEASRQGEWMLLSGWAAVAQGHWGEARDRLTEAQKQQLGPGDRARCQYWLGAVYQHDGEYRRAAEAFRAAYEASGR